MTREFKDGRVKDEAWKLCKDFLSGPWKELSYDEFKLFEVRGGLSNTLYRCALPENMKISDRSIPTEVLLRIYGPIQDDPNVVITEVVTFMLLSERKLGPKLYGVFPKGRLEEFIPCRSLNTDDLRNFSSIIAREMAKIHALEVPVRKIPDLWEISLFKWLDEVEEILKNDKENIFMTHNEYKKEIEWLSAEMKNSKSPIVYCHNDLQEGNILYEINTSKNGQHKLMLIDFEFGGYNYRGFDIANHFCEWCFDYDTKEFPHFTVDLGKFPSEEEQAEFFSSYLNQLLKEGIRLENPLKEEIEKMAKEVKLFVCAAHLQWHMWSIKMLLTSTDGFSHNEHGKTRRTLYQLFKDQYLATHS